MTVPAYDCEGRGTNFTVYSLNEIEKCAEIKEMEHRTNETIQVIQRREYEAMFVYNCDIKITRAIYHFGMSSHSSSVKKGWSNFKLKIRAADCEDLHRTRTFTYRGVTLTSLNMNATTVYTRVLAGSKSAEGSCRGSDYIEDEVTYSAVVVEIQFDVKLFQYTALVHMAKGGQPEIKLIAQALKALS